MQLTFLRAGARAIYQMRTASIIALTFETYCTPHASLVSANALSGLTSTSQIPVACVARLDLKALGYSLPSPLGASSTTSLLRLLHADFPPPHPPRTSAYQHVQLSGSGYRDFP
jgi:hypothetical protein